jgi:hypothetical protein
MQDETAPSTGLWKAAFDAGLVPVLCNMLRRGDEATVDSALTLATRLMRVTPPGLQGLEGRWASELPRAVAGLITAKPEVPPAAAIKALLNICSTHRDVLMDSHQRGLWDTLKLFSTHSDPEIAAAAKELLSVVNQPFEVRLTLPSPGKCNRCSFWYACQALAGLGCAIMNMLEMPLAGCGMHLCGVHWHTCFADAFLRA